MKPNNMVILTIPMLLSFVVNANAESLPAASDNPTPGLIKTGLHFQANKIAGAEQDQSTMEVSVNTSSDDGLSDEQAMPLSATLVLIASGLFGAALLGRRPSPRP